MKPEDTPNETQNDLEFKEKKENFVARFVETVKCLLLCHKDSSHKYSLNGVGIELCRTDLQMSRKDATNFAINGQEVSRGERQVEHALRFATILHIVKFVINRLFVDSDLQLTTT